MKIGWVLIAASIATTALAQTQEGRATVGSFGQWERDGSATYSIFAASRTEELGEVSIAVALPAGTRFIEALHRPSDVVFEGVQADVAYWSVPALEADTVIGPFVFRIKPDGSGKDLPGTLLTAISYQRPVPEAVQGAPARGILARFEDKGSITIDQRGTRNAAGANVPVFIGNTGAAIFVPEGAVDRQVTITAIRQNIDDLALPQTDPALWWCSVFEFRSEPRIAFSKPIQVVVPTRRAITPALTLSSISTTDPAGWAATAPKNALSPREFGFGGGFGSGGTCFPQFGVVNCSFGGGFGFGGFGGFGYLEQDNIKSRVSGAKVATTLSVPSAAGAVAGILPYIEQDNFRPR